MKRLLLFVLVFALSAVGARAQTAIAVRGNLQTLGVQNASGANTFVRFTLANIGGVFPVVTGSNAVVSEFRDFHTNGSGAISGQIWGNDSITPGGTTYQVCIFFNGIQFRCNNYLITAALYPSGFNLNTATPTPVVNSAVVGARSFVFTQSTPATTWTVTHNLNDPDPLIQCFNSSAVVLTPSSITFTNSNVITVVYATPQTGGCKVISAGTVNLVANALNALITNNPGPQSVLGPVNFSGAIASNSGFSTATTNSTGAGNHSGPETFTGLINCTILNIVRCISASNPQSWSGATPDAWISSAIASIGASGGELFIAAGTYNPVAQVAISTPVWIHGSGMNSTILKPTAALAAALFSSTTPVEGMKFSDMTIDMTNAPAQGAIAIPTGVRPILENVRILYPAMTGTGTAIFVASTGEVHARNIIMKGAGICVDINGDASAENFWTDIVCEDPGSFGYRKLQTTNTDVGGDYLLRFKVTNPDNRTTGQGFLVSSSVVGTGSPFYCVQCVGDNLKGGHTYQIHNMVNVFLNEIWATSTAPQASNFAGLSIDTCTNVFVRGGYMGSQSRDLVLSGTDANINLINNNYAGTRTNIFTAGSALNGVNLVAPIFASATPISAADFSQITNAAPAGISSNGWHVAVSGTQGQTQTFSICDKDVTDTTPCVFMRNSGAGGAFQILNNSFQNMLSINQAGTVATLGNSTLTQAIASGSTALGTTAIPAASCASTITLPATGAAVGQGLVITPNGAPSGGYASLTLSNSFISAGNVNLVVCNPTSAAVTPSPETVQWRVVQ
jgi:hypothetical protein